MQTVLCSARDLAGLVGAVTRTGQRVRFRALGSSMTPAIVAGESVWVAPVDAGGLAAGDIVLVGGPRPVLHRAVSVDHQRDLLVTRGDALAEDDPPTHLSAVVGRVVRIDRRWLVRARRVLRWRRRFAQLA